MSEETTAPSKDLSSALLNIFLLLFFSALIADNTGSYIYAFYMTGGVLFAAFLIPVIIIFINWRKSKVHSQTPEEEEDEEKKVDPISKEFQAELAQNFGRETLDGTLTGIRSSGTNT